MNVTVTTGSLGKVPYATPIFVPIRCKPEYQRNPTDKPYLLHQCLPKFRKALIGTIATN